MTAEISLLNRNGVVLAADSAVTIGGGKVYNSASKLFTLSPNHSIGVMIFGDANFMGIPWETIIKKYNLYISKEPLNTTEDYVDSFFEFIRSNDALISARMSDQHVFEYSVNLANLIFQLISPTIDALLFEEEVVDNLLIVKELERVLSIIVRQNEQSEFIIELDRNSFEINYKETVIEAFSSVSSKKEVTDEISDLFFDAAYRLIQHDDTYSSYSGIVISGFGKEDYFPSLYSYKFFANILGELKTSKLKSEKISNEGNVASILPFAQEDVVSTVITGIAPEISQDLFEILDDEQAITTEIKERIKTKIDTTQRDHFISPMVNTIRILPIDELADVAETLINLTGFKRKYTSDIATVGGPIDVLAITLGEGPVWIKRKHYFELEKNINFKIRKENYHDIINKEPSSLQERKGI